MTHDIQRSLAHSGRRVHDADVRLTDHVLSATPFHPSFWVRRRIRSSLAERASVAHGTLLDLGCGTRPYESIFADRVRRYVGMDYSPTSGYRGNRADLCGDAAAIPLAANSIDTVLCTELLEHVPDPDGVAREIARVLRPGGVAFVTAPFVYPVHDERDYFRYAPEGVATLLRRHGLEVSEVLPLSGTGLTIAVLFNVFWFDIGFMWTKWLYPLGIVLRPLLLVIVALVNALGWSLERALPSRHLSFNHLTIARKTARTAP